MLANDKVMIVCEDDFSIKLIEGILSKMGIHRISHVSVVGLINELPIDENTDLVIIDETRNTRDLLEMNKQLKTKFPQIVLIALTSYAEGEFDAVFSDSGADYVLPLDRLHGELAKICLGDKVYGN